MTKIADRHLVLCPGFMNDRGLWARMETGLAALSRCHFADLGQDTSLADIAHRVLAAAPAKFVLIGFSMGGYVAREVVKQGHAVLMLYHVHIFRSEFKPGKWS